MTRIFKVEVEDKTPSSHEVLVAAESVDQAREVAEVGRDRWICLLGSKDGAFRAVRAVEVKDGEEWGEKWPEKAGELDGIWRCPACGSAQVEANASVALNTTEIVSFDEGSDYWCPECNDGMGEHHKRICFVKGETCSFHAQPFAQCRRDNE